MNARELIKVLESVDSNTEVHMQLDASAIRELAELHSRVDLQWARWDLSQTIERTINGKVLILLARVLECAGGPKRA